jgi:hypothetical protein
MQIQEYEPRMDANKSAAINSQKRGFQLFAMVCAPQGLQTSARRFVWGVASYGPREFAPFRSMARSGQVSIAAHGLHVFSAAKYD